MISKKVGTVPFRVVLFLDPACRSAFTIISSERIRFDARNGTNANSSISALLRRIQVYEMVCRKDWLRTCCLEKEQQ